MPFSYFNQINYPNLAGGLGSFRPVVADFNGDGHADILTLRFVAITPPGVNAPAPLQLFLGDGLGGYVDGTNLMFPGGAPQTAPGCRVLVADFNGDGRPDVFIADCGADQPPFPGYHNTLVLSSGATGFVDATATHLPSVPDDYTYQAAAADIDGDGDIDIVVDDRQMNFLINSGDGHFTVDEIRLFPAAPFGPGSSWLSNELVDMDGDGDPDLLLAGNGGDARILLNDGDGFFLTHKQLPPTHFPDPMKFTEAVAIDVNGDGRLDVVTSSHDNTYNNSVMQVFVQHDDFTFVDETSAVMGASSFVGIVEQFFKYDVNSDGQLDLIAFMWGRTGQSQGMVFLMRDGDRLIPIDAGVVFDFGPDVGAPYDADGDGLFDMFATAFPGIPHVRLEFTGLPLVQVGDGADDSMMGDNDAETFNAGGGADTIFASGGNDTIIGGAGADYLNGGDGDDVIQIAAGDAAAGEVVNGGLGVDTLRTLGTSVDYRLAAITSVERIQFARVGSEATLNLILDAAQVSSGLSSTLAVSGSAAQDSIQIFAGLNGSVNTSGWTFEFPAWGFDDYIVYVGDTGAETFTGFAGLDIFFGSPGEDIYNGNGAFDFAAYIFSPNAVQADLAIVGRQEIGGNQNFDTFINLEGLAGSQLSDLLYGDGGANIILGLYGDDLLVGRGGDDDLRGAEGSDRIEGGMGADVLWGYSDLTGGADGGDTFVYRSAAEGGDTIRDFVAGQDLIEVSASGFGGGLAAGAAVSLVSGASPVAVSAQGHFLYDTDDGRVFWDVDGTGAQAPVLLVTLASRPALTAADFIVTPISAAIIHDGVAIQQMALVDDADFDFASFGDGGLPGLDADIPAFDLMRHPGVLGPDHFVIA